MAKAQCDAQNLSSRGWELVIEGLGSWEMRLEAFGVPLAGDPGVLAVFAFLPRLKHDIVVWPHIFIVLFICMYEYVCIIQCISNRCIYIYMYMHLHTHKYANNLADTHTQVFYKYRSCRP